jgi:hypothetical protein
MCRVQAVKWFIINQPVAQFGRQEINNGCKAFECIKWEILV